MPSLYRPSRYLQNRDRAFAGRVKSGVDVDENEKVEYEHDGVGPSLANLYFFFL